LRRRAILDPRRLLFLWHFSCPAYFCLSNLALPPVRIFIFLQLTPSVPALESMITPPCPTPQLCTILAFRNLPLTLQSHVVPGLLLRPVYSSTFHAYPDTLHTPTESSTTATFSLFPQTAPSLSITHFLPSHKPLLLLPSPGRPFPSRVIPVFFLLSVHSSAFHTHSSLCHTPDATAPAAQILGGFKIRGKRKNPSCRVVINSRNV